MRGKEVVFIDSYLVSRITPAYAGKRDYRMKPNRVSGDHPRVCGEKPQDYTGYKLAVGSPPRMRGKGVLCIPVANTGRITPAYAGKRLVWFRSEHFAGDHPRVCGEKLLHCLSLLPDMGSPPRMRGKVFRNLQTAVRTWDHPRVCGEKSSI